MAKYRIHFTDNYGCASFDVEGEAQRNEALANLRDSDAEDIWVESYNEEEGYWEA